MSSPSADSVSDHVLAIWGKRGLGQMVVWIDSIW
jgi:hypothetical protein